jgi:rhamnose transport system ATP-binding protein
VTVTLQCTKVSKWYGPSRVLDAVDLEVLAGEIHVLLGENGAGKSTLMKIVAGLLQPEAGAVYLDGSELPYGSVARAQGAGVALIHQEPRLFPDLTVLENVWIDQRSGRTLRRFQLKAVEARTRALLDELGCAVSTRAKVRDLSVADQQLVDIAAALRRELRVLIVDEPTAALTPKEVQTLFGVLRRLRDRGVAIVFIGHRLEEILDVSDRITVLRDGAVVTTLPTAGATEEQLIRLMVGRDITLGATERGRPVGDAVLQVRGLSSRGSFEDVSFTAHRGEILGIGGLVGSGRSELLEAVVGARARSAGSVALTGVQVRSVRQAAAAGMALVPEDRARAGLFVTRSLLENVAAANLDATSRGPLRGKADERRVAEGVVRRMGVRTSGLSQTAGQLSGGNQQRISLGRWLARSLTVLLVDEPTRGVDIASKAQIHDILRRLAAEGLAVVMVSSDMRELLQLSDRIVVMREGRAAGELTPEQASEESVLRLAAGVTA